MRYIYSLLILLPLLWLAPTATAQVAQCDADRSCVGTALTSDVTVGKGAQYVDVDTSAVLRSLSSEMTFEAWIRPQPQPGTRQFVAGLWGPNQDNNDQWVVYIEGNTITFALSADGSRQGTLDNTVATVTLPDLYTRGWLHLAAVWDGTSTAARIFIDGFQAAQGTNPQFPLTQLHQPENRALPMQIGSCNALYDDTTTYRTFKGQLDEIRLWNRALTQQEILCQRIRSLAGNESGLILYYRCNEPPNTQTLCDASGNGLYGRMRSGARCEKSSRTVPATYSVTPSSITGDFICTSDTTVQLIVVDTSYCGNRVNLGLYGPNAKDFAISKTSMNLQQNVPDTFLLTMHSPAVGNIVADIRITNADRCGDPVVVTLRFKRRTLLSYSDSLGTLPGPLMLDTLFVGCIDRTTTERKLVIHNDPKGGPMRIDSLAFGFGDSLFTKRYPDPAKKPPMTLAPGDSLIVYVQMKVADTTRTYRDILHVFNGDTCLGGGSIAVQGHTQDVLMIFDETGKKRLDSLRFGRVCPGQISDVLLFQYVNLSPERIYIDTMIYSPNGVFFGRRYLYPLLAESNYYYQPTFVRFKPDRPGPITGELQVRTTFRGCTIVKKVKLSGTGISVDVEFKDKLADFGNVTIGKSKQLGVDVTNKGEDMRTMSAYLKVGDVFSIISPATFTINPNGGTAQVRLEFRPREPKRYYDTLCLFDQQCFQTICIPITGVGVFEDLSFNPPYINLQNVLGCECKTATIDVKNISGRTFSVTPSLTDFSGGRITLVPPAASGTLPPGQSFSYTIKYCPNDLSGDRADRAFIRLQLSDGQVYEILVRATSVAPKLYVTPLTAFGTVEVGWNKTDRILVENISSVPVVVTNAVVPAGYTIVGYSRSIPVTLDPRDSLFIDVKFAPMGEGDYPGKLTVISDSPCPIQPTGDLSGRGVIVRLDVPLSFYNFAFRKPCDCPTFDIPLWNTSQYIPITIDSVWIDGQGVASPNPTVFGWSSKQTGGTTTPYQLAPQSSDTLVVSFCPNIPAIQTNMLSNAVLHIRASTPGWSQEFRTTLSGRREMNFVPDYGSIIFPNTRVDTSSAGLIVTLTVPDRFSNPSGDSVVITNLTFAPDKRVFSYQAVNGQPLPWVIHRGENFQIRFIFYPRAPKTYTARVQLETSFPCKGVDTTILLTGTGFAPAFGMQMAFDTAAVGQDTIRLTTCDTLELPVMIDRDIPQDLIDILFRIGYDTTELKFIDIRSPYTGTATVIDTGDGTWATLKNARNTLAGTIATVRFAVTGGAGAFPIYLDNVNFDSDSLVYYKIVPGGDNGWVIIDQPMIAMTKMTEYDTVNLKYCADRQITVWNPGAIPIRFDSLGGLPPGHRVTASSIPYPAILAPGDSIILTVTFCPFIEKEYDTTVSAWSGWPCSIADSGRLHSVGWAPPFPMRIILDGNIGVVDTLGGTIADTIEVPMLMDRDIPQTPLDIGFTLAYNRRALQFLGISSSYTQKITATQVDEGLDIGIPHCDSVRKGEIARARFAVAVPDVTVSPMTTGKFIFASDSIWWVKLRPTGDTSAVRVDARCNITRLDFPGGSSSLKAVAPNPASGLVTIDVQFVEDVPATLRLVNSAGVEVARLLDGSQRLHGGAYRLQFDAAQFPDGIYFCVFEAGRFHATEQLVIVK
jgi:hypothetical protein